MELIDVENMLREIQNFQFTQTRFVYDMKLEPGIDELAVYGTGKGSTRGHFYGNYSIKQISNWLLRKSNGEKINGYEVEEFYETYLTANLPEVDVFSVL